ncbi:MAG TPA: DUF1003 domain-containing protein [Stellaceae bacterium]|jgi:uncharacterized membrane protein|nr:DUF1003 domain-containing protein [Stellaceae bacterium]
MQAHPAHSMEADELTRLVELRRHRRVHRKAKGGHDLPLGARVSDGVARVVGSWRFIIVQSVLLVIWMGLNVTAWVQQWDPYPFILLNLALSFQAAYTAPILMMSQNRQSEIDRRAAQHDYDINLKAELEIELLHQKVDLLREKEINELIGIIRTLQAALCDASGRPLAQVAAAIPKPAT